MSYGQYTSELSLCATHELNGPERSLLLRFSEPPERTERFHSYLWFRKQSGLGIEDEKLLRILLNRNLIEEIHRNMFRRGYLNYALTTCGLFYILTSIRKFSVHLLVKYCENVILKKLLFEYLEVDSVKHCSPQFATIISEYLHNCCITTKRTIELIRASKIPEERDKHGKLLELDLNTYAVSFGIELTRMYNWLYYSVNKKNSTFNYHVNDKDVRMLRLLSKDEKLTRFRKGLLNELDEAYTELARLKVE
jgi:hypothetical protein